MSQNFDVERVFELDQMLNSFVTAMAQSAQQLAEIQKRPGFAELPMEYRIPEMSIDVKLALGFEENKVKGFFWKKSNTGNTAEVASTLSIKMAAVPRDPNPS